MFRLEALESKCGPTSGPVAPPGARYQYSRYTQLRNCLTASDLQWYSGYTYLLGEVLMPSNFQPNVKPECVSLARALRVLAAVCAVLLAGVSACPQGSTGRILGVVTDQSGGNVASATVTVTDVARGVSQTLTTDSDGACCLEPPSRHLYCPCRIQGLQDL